MMNAFDEHTANQAAYESDLGGGDPLGFATLTFTSSPGAVQSQLIVPVTHTKIDVSYILSSGMSPTTTIERCEFRAALVVAAWVPFMFKGTKCSLCMRPGTPPIALQLWDGGLMAGAGMYRFMLVDANFHA